VEGVHAVPAVDPVVALVAVDDVETLDLPGRRSPSVPRIVGFRPKHVGSGVCVGVAVGVDVGQFVGVAVGLAVPVGLAVDVPVGVAVPVALVVGLAELVGGQVTDGTTESLAVEEGPAAASAVVDEPLSTAAAPTTAAAVVLARTADRIMRVR
jgi:hypothetical protein